MIEQEFKKLFPDYQLTNAQKRAIGRANNPELVAASLQNQFLMLKHLFDRYLGPDVAEDKDILSRLILETPISGLGEMSLDWLLQNLPRSRVFYLGRKSNDYWRNLYKDLFNREPDEEGVIWWMNTVKEMVKDGSKNS